MWCIIFWFLDLECVSSFTECIQRNFPLKCNNIYSMGWLHLASAVSLGISSLLLHAEHGRDVAFNKNWRAKNKALDEVVLLLPKVTTRNPETELLLEMWEGMFKNNYNRGVNQPIFLYTCATIGAINAIMFVLAVIVWLRNCKGGIHYKHDWIFHKGYPGFAFTFVIFLMMSVLLVMDFWELAELLDTEMIYETYFPYCMKDEYFLNRFCILSHVESSTDNDFCKEIKHAIKNSYLCHDYYRKRRARLLALLAGVFHILMCFGYAQLAFRPWGWKKKRLELKMQEAYKEYMQDMHEKLQEKAPEKLKAAQEQKAVKVIEQKRREVAINAERERLEKEIKIKNAKRRLNRRAEREERRNSVQKEKEEEQQQRRNSGAGTENQS